MKKLQNLSPSEKISDWRQKLNDVISVVNSLAASARENVGPSFPILIEQGGTGQTDSRAAIGALLPPQKGNSEKFLKTNGTDIEWASVNQGPVGAPSLENAKGILGVANGGTGTNSIDEFRRIMFGSLVPFPEDHIVRSDMNGSWYTQSIEEFCYPLKTDILSDIYLLLSKYVPDHIKESIAKISDAVEKNSEKFSSMENPETNGTSLLAITSEPLTEVTQWSHIKIGDFFSEILDSSESDFNLRLEQTFARNSNLLKSLENNYKDFSLLTSGENGDINYLPLSSSVEEFLLAEDFAEMQSLLIPIEKDFFEGLKAIDSEECETGLLTNRFGIGPVLTAVSDKFMDFAENFREDDIKRFRNVPVDLSKKLAVVDKLNAIDSGILAKGEDGDFKSFPMFQENLKILTGTADDILETLGLKNVIKNVKVPYAAGYEVNLKGGGLRAVSLYEWEEGSQIVFLSPLKDLMMDFRDGTEILVVLQDSDTHIISIGEYSYLPQKFRMIVKKHSKHCNPTILWDVNVFHVDENGFDLSHDTNYFEFVKIPLFSWNEKESSFKYACVLQKGFDFA